MVQGAGEARGGRGGSSGASQALKLLGIGWADFIDPGLHVAVDGDDLLAAIRRSSHAEFSLITIGWIGRIFGAAIQEDMIKMPGYQFFSAYTRRAGRHLSIADTYAGADG